MAEGQTISLHEAVFGLQDVLRVFDGLDAVQKNRGVRAVVRRGVVILAREIRKAAPVVQSYQSARPMKDRVGFRAGKRFSGGRGFAKAGVSVGKPRLRRGDSGGWLHVIATGTRDRVTRSGANRGRVIGNGFVRNTANRVQNQVVVAMAEQQRKFLDRETVKLARRRAAR